MKLLTTTLQFFPRSLVSHQGIEYGLAKTDHNTRLAILGAPQDSKLVAFDGETSDFDGLTLCLAPTNHHNANTLRKQIPWLQPRPIGLATSAGMGDRLGLATPGHVRAVQAVGGQIAPIFAQQSMREMARTIRTPQQVMDDATWGIFQEGWKSGVGADADHLKSPTDMDACLAAGFTFFTIDPGEHVDNRAETASRSSLSELAELLPDEVRPQKSGLTGKIFQVEGYQFNIDEVSLLKAAVKYGAAIAHVAKMYLYLAQSASSHPFELEVSVDETDQPTTPIEHIYIASELKRLGVQWVSLAPRYTGRFEKGVDYIGDLDEFEADFACHAAIARHFGPYKLSLHSGSDKFSIYPIAMRQTQGLVHLKTAGTSYLEALRTIAELDPDLSREIYTYAREHYETDRRSYHVSARLEQAPLPEEVLDWTGLTDQFDAREILHVTYGSVLTEKNTDHTWRFFDRFMHLLRNNPEAYAKNLEKHFVRHLQPFVSAEKK